MIQCAVGATIVAIDSKSNSAAVRIDVWLWAVRVFKTRSLAGRACRLGRVLVAGKEVKASRLVRVDDLLSVDRGELRLELRVVALLEKRVGAKVVAEYVEDLTSDEAKAEAGKVAAERRANRIAMPWGDGRPTKLRRRRMSAFLEEVERRSNDS